MKLEVEQQTRNWLDLPSEVMTNIFYRIGIIDIFESAQKVCTAWREISKDPAMWRVLYMDVVSSYPNTNILINGIFKHAVDRSQGQLADFTMVESGYNEIVEYIANRCNQLKRLSITCFDDNLDYNWTESLKKFPLLEELSLFVDCNSSLLKMFIDDQIATAIGHHLPELRHLELIGSTMFNQGLETILDGCHHLESLDLRGCFLIDLDGDLGKRCLRQIKCVKLPKGSLEGCPYSYTEDV